VVTGCFSGTVNFGGGSRHSVGDYDIFLAKYAGGGVHQWSHAFGDSFPDCGNSVTVDGSGSVFMTGSFRRAVNFGGGVLTSAGSDDIFLAKYDAGGLHQWSQRFGGTRPDEGRSVAVDGSGGVVMTGFFQEQVDFGGGPINTDDWEPKQDVFLAKFAANTAEPVITSITDIGNDQGRQVKIRFLRSGHDDPASPTWIEQYEAYRRNDPPPASSMAWQGPAGLSARELRADGWTQVGTVSAHGESAYHIDVPTIGDSTITLGSYHSIFFMRATTGTPFTFFDSPPDTGYSVDNLSPGVPASFAYSAGLLSWDESVAGDFDYFSVYGSNADAFGAATLVDYTVAPGLDVTTSPYEFYFVTATDFSGNEGKPARVNTLSGVGGTRRDYVLSVSAYPNPFNPETTVRYTVPSRGRVTLVVYDARGAHVATLVDAERGAGAYTATWDGRDEAGHPAGSGVYFARLASPSGTRSYKMTLLK